MSDKQQKARDKSLIWVYPPNNWISNYKQTFVYGWSNPRAKLFIVAGTKVKAGASTKITIFPNGNFAQTIKLAKKLNVVQLVQVLNERRKILTRIVITRRLKEPMKQFSYVRRLLRSLTLPRNDVSLKDAVIIIDPGHGGREHGTHSPKGIPESHFNLQIAKLLFQKLRKKVENVYLTRTKDKFVSLKDRVNFAKKKKCNLLISIHHNALPDNKDPLKHRGVGIYYTHDFVKPLAKSLLKSISELSGLKQYGIFKRNFVLTKASFCYAILIECGFLTNPIEAEYVTKRKTQEKIASGIVQGLRFMKLTIEN